MPKRTESSPPSQPAKDGENPSPSHPETLATTPSPTPAPVPGNTVTPTPNEDYSKLILKIYMDHELYSIFDRARNKYIYHVKDPLCDDFVVAYSEDGWCVAIYDKDGNEVYVKGGRR